MQMPIRQNKILSHPASQGPEHVAIIMDGNGRWAKQRGLKRVAGHEKGISAVINTVKTAVKYDVKFLTLYTFSTENWKRPAAEVEFLMRLPKQFLQTYLPELIENHVRVQVIGDVRKLPIHTRMAVQKAIDQTKHNDGLQLNIALNYGGRHELVDVMKKMLIDYERGGFSLGELDDQKVDEYLYTTGMPDPDLLIRTGGEKRISNFLLWQLAYTEFWFCDVLWPDFCEADFTEAITEFQRRKRRFGGLER